jgi:hypothetical protein
MIYKIMPRARIAWHDVWVGAAVTAVLFEIGKFLIGLYLGKSGVTSGFGAAGSLVVLCCGSITQRRFSCWARSSPGCMRINTGPGRAKRSLPVRHDCRAARATAEGRGDRAHGGPGPDRPGCGQGVLTSERRSARTRRAAPGAGVRSEIRICSQSAASPHSSRRHPYGGLGLVVTAGLLAGTLVSRWLVGSRTRSIFRRGDFSLSH